MRTVRAAGHISCGVIMPANVEVSIADHERGTAIFRSGQLLGFLTLGRGNVGTVAPDGVPVGSFANPSAAIGALIRYAGEEPHAL